MSWLPRPSFLYAASRDDQFYCRSVAPSSPPPSTLLPLMIWSPAIDSESPLFPPPPPPDTHRHLSPPIQVLTKNVHATGGGVRADRLQTHLHSILGGEGGGDGVNGRQQRKKRGGGRKLFIVALLQAIAWRKRGPPGGPFFFLFFFCPRGSKSVTLFLPLAYMGGEKTGMLLHARSSGPAFSSSVSPPPPSPAAAPSIPLFPFEPPHFRGLSRFFS